MHSQCVVFTLDEASINNDKGIVTALNMVEEIQKYGIGFVFGHVRIRNEHIYDFICVHGAKCNRTLQSGVISQ